MRKLKSLVIAGVAAAALVAPAAPAQASCETELGDMCKFMDFVCDTYPKVTHVVFAYCRA
ncbi:MAG: hypothetical protein ABR613_06600 [Actinomycetota bacterium]